MVSVHVNIQISMATVVIEIHFITDYFTFHLFIYSISLDKN